MIINFLISFSSDFGTVFTDEITDPQGLSAKALIKSVVKVRIVVITQAHTHTYIQSSKGITIKKW